MNSVIVRIGRLGQRSILNPLGLAIISKRDWAAQAATIKSQAKRLQELRQFYQVAKTELQAVESIIDPVAYNTARAMNSFYAIHTEETPMSRTKCQFFYNLMMTRTIINRGDNILDAGCGLGTIAGLVDDMKMDCRVHGCDYSETAITTAQAKYPGIKFFHHDLAVPIPGQYDLVMCIEVLEHIQDPGLAMANLLASLKDRGRLFMTVPDGATDVCTRHINHWDAAAWQAFLASSCDGRHRITTGAVDHPTQPGYKFQWAVIRKGG